MTINNESTLYFAVVPTPGFTIPDIGQELPWNYVASIHNSMAAALTEILITWGECAGNLKSHWPVAVPVDHTPQNKFFVVGDSKSVEYLELLYSGKED